MAGHRRRPGARSDGGHAPDRRRADRLAPGGGHFRAACVWAGVRLLRGAASSSGECRAAGGPAAPARGLPRQPAVRRQLTCGNSLSRSRCRPSPASKTTSLEQTSRRWRASGSSRRAACARQSYTCGANRAADAPTFCEPRRTPIPSFSSPTTSRHSIPPRSRRCSSRSMPHAMDRSRCLRRVLPHPRNCPCVKISAPGSPGAWFTLKPLTDAEKALHLRAEAGRRGLRLSDEVVWSLLNHLPRDLASLHRVLEVLDRYSLASQRAVTLPLVREALSAAQDCATCLDKPGRPE